MTKIQNLLKTNLVSLLIALAILPPGLLPAQPAYATDEIQSLPIVDLGESTHTAEGRSLDELNQDHFRIDASLMPPDDGFLDAQSQPLMIWKSDESRAAINSGLSPESRYLLMLRRTAVEEALKARGMLYLLVGGNDGIATYLQTHERSGAANLREALCRVDPEHPSCASGARANDPDLTFALPCETKALFGMHDERCTDPAESLAWGGHATTTSAPTARSRARSRERVRDERREVSEKFESVRRLEAFLQRSRPNDADFTTAQNTGITNSQQLRRQVLGVMIYHSLQIIQLQRLHRYISEELPQAIAAARPVTSRSEAGMERQQRENLEIAQRQVTEAYGGQLQSLEVAHNTILSQVPFLAVQVAERPFYEFIYCFLQGRSPHNTSRTQYCGDGVGFPDFYAPLGTDNAGSYIARHGEAAELPGSFRQPFEDLVAELEGEGNQALEQRILNHSGWALKKLLTEALASNTAALVGLSNSSPRFITTTGGDHQAHCRVVGRHCRMLENLARYDLLHDRVKQRFGTYAHSAFFPQTTEATHGMDPIRDRILRALGRVDAANDRIRNYVDAFLWGITAVEVMASFGLGAAVGSLQGVAGGVNLFGRSSWYVGRATVIGARAGLLGSELLNLSAAYGVYQNSLTQERYTQALFRGVPGTVSPADMADAEHRAADDLIQLYVSAITVVMNFTVLDRIFRATGSLVRGGARVALAPAPAREWLRAALQRSVAIAEAGGEGALRGAIRPILTNRAIRLLEGLSVYGRSFLEPVSHTVALQRLATLEGRSVAAMTRIFGERLTSLMGHAVGAPGRANAAAARFLHTVLFNHDILEESARAGGILGIQALRRGGIRGWFRWVRSVPGRPMAEAVRSAEINTALEAARIEGLTASARGAALAAAQARLGRTLTTEEAHAALVAAAPALRDEVVDQIVIRTLLATPTNAAISVPWLRDFLRTEIHSAGIMTLVNVYQRYNAGTLSETTPQVVADGAMDLAMMAFIIMRSPTNLGRAARVSTSLLDAERAAMRGLGPPVPAMYLAHRNARSAAILTPMLAISSVAGAGIGLATGDQNIDTSEEWAHFLRQSRNRMVFDIGIVSLNSPWRSTLRDSVHEDFRDAGAVGRLLINGYYGFDFTALCYPVYIYGRDAMGLDRLPERVRAMLGGDNPIFMSVRTPDMPNPDDLLLPTAGNTLSRFALGE